MRFTAFLVISLVAVLFLIGYVCYLFVAYADTETAFLATEVISCVKFRWVWR